VTFLSAGLQGAFLLDLERRADTRGFFARTWCKNEFASRGLTTDFVQANLACSLRRGTLRGLHYQVAPFGEVKLVCCLQGAIWDVMVDLRPDSSTYRQWFGVELNAIDRRQVYVPAGVAHGYQSLVDDAVVSYQVSEFYTPAAERGVRWNDPAFSVQWPISIPSLSPKDEAWPDVPVPSVDLRIAAGAPNPEHEAG
jgi:dTDP-4-dehydrorhamnose 3,5-epimerase